MAALNIPRLPGEDEAEYLRRYTREKMRIYRARKPKGPKRVRGKAGGPKADGLLSVEEWEALKQLPGETSEDWVRRKQRDRQAAWRARNPAMTKERSRTYYVENAEKERTRNALYIKENAAKVKTARARYYQENKERRIENARLWKLNNKERHKAWEAAWREANRALCAFYSASWRRAAREQTPKWVDLDKIKAIYAEAQRVSAETGIPHHVDHVIPLRGKNVSGLHVHTNMQVIPGVENVRKHNKFSDA